MTPLQVGAVHDPREPVALLQRVRRPLADKRACHVHMLFLYLITATSRRDMMLVEVNVARGGRSPSRTCAHPQDSVPAAAVCLSCVLSVRPPKDTSC